MEKLFTPSLKPSADKPLCVAAAGISATLHKLRRGGRWGIDNPDYHHPLWVDVKLGGSLSRLAISVPTIIMGIIKYAQRGRVSKVRVEASFISFRYTNQNVALQNSVSGNW